MQHPARAKHPSKKIVFIQGDIKFTPKLKPDKLNLIKQGHRLHDFGITFNSIYPARKLKLYENEMQAFDEINYVVVFMQDKKPKYRGEILGLVECAPNLFKQCKFYIENNKVKIGDIEYRLTKKGTPRGPRQKVPALQNDRILQPPKKQLSRSPIVEEDIAPTQKKLDRVSFHIWPESPAASRAQSST